MFKDWRVEFSSGIPVYRQIENLLFYEIGNGNLREGDRLPSIKELAERFNINPNTVAKAYRGLDLKGIITSRRGDGSFVAALTAQPRLLNKVQRIAKMDELFGRLLAEAKAAGLNELELLTHMKERLEENDAD